MLTHVCTGSEMIHGLEKWLNLTVICACMLKTTDQLLLFAPALKSGGPISSSKDPNVSAIREG